MIPEIKAIQTWYGGFRFRSRLEARWAVFFDELAIPWIPEAQGYAVAGTPYLPDFWLPHQNMYFEVKPGALLSDYRIRLGDLARGGKRRVVMAAGSIPRPDTFWPGTVDKNPGFFMEVYYPDGNMDETHAWCRCDECGATDVQWNGLIDRTCGHPGPQRWNHWAINAAYVAARSARFEHGESGRTQ